MKWTKLIQISDHKSCVYIGSHRPKPYSYIHTMSGVQLLLLILLLLLLLLLLYKTNSNSSWFISESVRISELQHPRMLAWTGDYSETECDSAKALLSGVSNIHTLYISWNMCENGLQRIKHGQSYVQTTPWHLLARALSRVSLSRDTRPSARREIINKLLESCLQR